MPFGAVIPGVAVVQTGIMGMVLAIELSCGKSCSTILDDVFPSVAQLFLLLIMIL